VLTVADGRKKPFSAHHLQVAGLVFRKQHLSEDVCPHQGHHMAPLKKTLANITQNMQ
jgi:hypothetical protein